MLVLGGKWGWFRVSVEIILGVGCGEKIRSREGFRELGVTSEFNRL
jgi:hypothetical protein